MARYPPPDRHNPCNSIHSVAAPLTGDDDGVVAGEAALGDGKPFLEAAASPAEVLVTATQ